MFSSENLFSTRADEREIIKTSLSVEKVATDCKNRGVNSLYINDIVFLEILEIGEFFGRNVL